MNCLCNIFDNNNFIWILIIAFLLISCCSGCGNCGSNYNNGCGC